MSKQKRKTETEERCLSASKVKSRAPVVEALAENPDEGPSGAKRGVLRPPRGERSIRAHLSLSPHPSPLQCNFIEEVSVVWSLCLGRQQTPRAGEPAPCLWIDECKGARGEVSLSVWRMGEMKVGVVPTCIRIRVRCPPGEYRLGQCFWR